MQQSRKALIREAAIRAIAERSKMGVPLTDAIDPFHVAKREGIIVRFAELPSLEGFFNARDRRIVLSSLRPWVRQAFTCAHELGHYFLGHGFQIDELIEQRESSSYSVPEELAADAFAGELLMPRTTVNRGFLIRGFAPQNANPAEYFIVSQWLGVGYVTLLNHLHYFQGVIDRFSFEKLKKCRRQTIRSGLLGEVSKDEVFVVDSAWSGRTIDMSLGDNLLTDEPFELGFERVLKLEEVNNSQYPHRYRAIARGYCDVVRSGGRLTTIRVSPRYYVGLEKYRYLTEDE